jgi:hypothetical protein
MKIQTTQDQDPDTGITQDVYRETIENDQTPQFLCPKHHQIHHEGGFSFGTEQSCQTEAGQISEIDSGFTFTSGGCQSAQFFRLFGLSEPEAKHQRLCSFASRAKSLNKFHSMVRWMIKC